MRGLAHLAFELLDLARELLPRHLHAVFALALRRGGGGDLDEIADGFDDGLRHDAVRLVVVVLNLAAALGLVHGAAHRGGDGVGVEHDKAVGVSRGAADGLDETRFAAEEAFLIRVQNRDHRDLGDVKALAQEVDADEHVELAEAQAADELHALDGLDVRVHVAHADADAGQILRQVLGHLFRQRGDEHALIARRAGVDLADEIIDLVFDRAHLDLRVE